MAVEISAGGELAQRLQGIVGPKLVEVGWSSGLQDDTLTEYIILMLANGKSQEEIAVELARDLLDLAPDDQSARDFSTWLFQQVAEQQADMNGPSFTTAENFSSDPQDVSMDQGALSSPQDAENGNSSSTQQSIPTGPKAMRNGNGRGRERMFNQINRSMDRTNDSLHRVHGAGAGTGRINSHSGRGGVRGNKAQQIQRNFDGANRRTMNQNQQFGMMQGSVNAPQQQFLQMMEEHARMMAQMAAQHGFVNPNFNSQRSQGNGNSMFDRSQKPQTRNKHRQQGKTTNKDDDTAMEEEGASHAGNGSEEQKDPATTLCKFNTYCTKPDCPFAHQTPAAPPGVSVDVTSECSYGVACKNFKCVSRHPSPAKKFEHQQQQECKFGPYCQNAKCSFKHSSAKPCRNGGDCATPGCTFFHSPIECKFNPCTNPRCQFKHKEGQKTVSTNVWKAGEGNEHISERKFVDDESGQEEVIIPGGASNVEAEATAMAT